MIYGKWKLAFRCSKKAVEISGAYYVKIGHEDVNLTGCSDGLRQKKCMKMYIRTGNKRGKKLINIASSCKGQKVLLFAAKLVDWK